MAINKPANYVIAYDIADPRRLGRVHRLLKREAASLQYSVFALRASEQQLRSLFGELEELIDARDDDVRGYRLPERCEVVMLGRQAMPEGITMSGDDVAGLLAGLRVNPDVDNLDPDAEHESEEG